MRWLVTGGLGVIGSRITSSLIARGDSVEIVDAAEEPRNKWTAQQIAHGRVNINFGRLENADIDALLSRADAVIHAAAHTGIPHSVIDPDDDWRSNVDATRHLLEGLRKNPKPTVMLSSVKPYDTSSMPLTESSLLLPDEPYAASKAAQSMLAMAYARSYGLPVVTFRCSNLYGPAPCHGPRHGWFTWFCISAAIGRPIEVQGTGEQSRDMLHARDVYTACLCAIDNIGRTRGKVYNIGGGANNRTTVNAVANKLRELSGIEIRQAPARAMDDDHVWVDYSAYNRDSGWFPIVSPDAGLREVFAWAMQHRDDLAKLYEVER